MDACLLLRAQDTVNQSWRLGPKLSAIRPSSAEAIETAKSVFEFLQVDSVFPCLG